MEEDGGPVTPIPACKLNGKGKERAALGVLGTPEIDEWVKAGRSENAAKEGKRVGFAGESDSDSEPDGVRAAGGEDSDEDSDDARDARAHLVPVAGPG